MRKNLEEKGESCGKKDRNCHFILEKNRGRKEVVVTARTFRGKFYSESGKMGSQMIQKYNSSRDSDCNRIKLLVGSFQGLFTAVYHL